MLKSCPYQKIPYFIRNFKKKLDLWEMNQKYKNFISKTCMAYKHSFFTHVSFKIYVLPIFTLIWTHSDSSLTESQASLCISIQRLVCFYHLNQTWYSACMYQGSHVSSISGLFNAYAGVFCAFEHFWFTVLGTLLRESHPSLAQVSI